MSELDFSRDAVPHTRGIPTGAFRSESDEYARLTLLPLLSRLDEDQRASFDESLLAHFAPEVEEPSRFAAQVVMRRLPMADLQLTVQGLQDLLDPPVWIIWAEPGAGKVVHASADTSEDRQP